MVIKSTAGVNAQFCRRGGRGPSAGVDQLAADTTLADILDGGAERLDSLNDQPLVKSRLLATIGQAYNALGLYDQAEAALGEARTIRVRENGPLSPETADVSRSLAVTYLGLGRLDAAIELAEEALQVASAAEPMDADQVVEAAGVLTDGYMRAGRFEEALAAADRGFELLEGSSPSVLPLAEFHGDRGAVLSRLGRQDEALVEMQRALEMMEEVERPDHPSIAPALSDLGAVYAQSGRLEEAASVMARALEINEGQLEPDNPFFAVVLHNLGALNLDMERYDLARDYLERAITARENTYGSDHPAVTSSLNNLAAVHVALREYEEALPLYERSARIRETALGPEHPALALSYHGMAQVYRDLERYTDSAEYFARAIEIKEIHHAPDLASTLRNYAEVLRVLGRDAEAEAGEAGARELEEEGRGRISPTRRSQRATCATPRNRARRPRRLTGVRGSRHVARRGGTLRWPLRVASSTPAPRGSSRGSALLLEPHRIPPGSCTRVRSRPGTTTGSAA